MVGSSESADEHWEEVASSEHKNVEIMGLAMDGRDSLLVCAFDREKEEIRAGSIMKVEHGKMSDHLVLEGSMPRGVLFDEDDAMFICDGKQKCILSRAPVAEGMESFTPVSPLVSDYEGKPLLGPNSMVFDSFGTLYFTDSGPLSSFDSNKGSVFAVSSADQLLKSLAYKCLAFPTGIAVDGAGSTVYVSETLNNRILRFAKRQNGVFYSSVYKTFKGCFGPTALVCDSAGRLIVLRTELELSGTVSGNICILDENAKVLKEIATPGQSSPGPEVWGMIVGNNSRGESNLYVSERSRGKIWSLPMSQALHGLPDVDDDEGFNDGFRRVHIK